MELKIYTFLLDIDFKLITELSGIDKFGGGWLTVERREGQSLKELKSIATVRSVGASTRIEGSKLNNDEVQQIIENVKPQELEERDVQEVLGYYEALDVIAESYEQIGITENNIKHLHNVLLKYSTKDEWHKGDYKQHSNVVEATHADGTKHIVFQTTEPGFATEDAMRRLISWYNSETEIHPVIKCAAFVYDFLSIHPFQDGNGRLSRLLATLLLLKNGYTWVQYVSFEHEIESRKSEYYRVLRHCQSQRPGEDIYPWIMFFLNGLNNIQEQLLNKLNADREVAQITPRDKKIFVFIECHPGCRSGEISDKLRVPLPTIKKILAEMVKKKLITRHGVGRATQYSIE
jgi:Fic family protein